MKVGNNLLKFGQTAGVGVPSHYRRRMFASLVSITSFTGERAISGFWVNLCTRWKRGQAASAPLWRRRTNDVDRGALAAAAAAAARSCARAVDVGRAAPRRLHRTGTAGVCTTRNDTEKRTLKFACPW